MSWEHWVFLGLVCLGVAEIIMYIVLDHLYCLIQEESRRLDLDGTLPLTETTTTTMTTTTLSPEELKELMERLKEHKLKRIESRQKWIRQLNKFIRRFFRS